MKFLIRTNQIWFYKLSIVRTTTCCTIKRVKFIALWYRPRKTYSRIDRKTVLYSYLPSPLSLESATFKVDLTRVSLHAPWYMFVWRAGSSYPLPTPKTLAVGIISYYVEGWYSQIQGLCLSQQSAFYNLFSDWKRLSKPNSNFWKYKDFLL